MLTRSETYPETYLDANAGAPLKPAAVNALNTLFQSGIVPANASSIHAHGRSAKRLLALAREQVASSLGVDSEQILFTSSGSEANQLAIRSVLGEMIHSNSCPHWITTPVEHDSTLQMVEEFKARGGEVSFLPLNATGAVDVHALPQLIRPETCLISAVWVNNETGIINDIQELIRIARAHCQAGCQPRQIPVHIDAAQAWGKIPINLEALGAQYVSFSGHKIGALSGIGALWLGRGCTFKALLPGKQEKGRRGGTENLAGAVTLGAAAQEITQAGGPVEWATRVAPLRDRLQAEICHRIPGTIVNGEGAIRVANTLNLSFDAIEGDGLVMALDLAGYSVSAGSACASGVLEPSHVLLAMGRTKLQAMASIRVSLVDVLPWETLEGFMADLEKIIQRIRDRGNFAREARLPKWPKWEVSYRL